MTITASKTPYKITRVLVNIFMLFNNLEVHFKFWLNFSLIYLLSQTTQLHFPKLEVAETLFKSLSR